MILAVVSRAVEQALVAAIFVLAGLAALAAPDRGAEESDAAEADRLASLP